MQRTLILSLLALAAVATTQPVDFDIDDGGLPHEKVVLPKK